MERSGGFWEFVPTKREQCYEVSGATEADQQVREFISSCSDVFQLEHLHKETAKALQLLEGSVEELKSADAEAYDEDIKCALRENVDAVEAKRKRLIQVEERVEQLKQMPHDVIRESLLLREAPGRPSLSSSSPSSIQKTTASSPGQESWRDPPVLITNTHSDPRREGEETSGLQL